MLPDSSIQIISLTVNALLLLFVVYYVVALREKEKELHDREKKFDTDYHHVVDEALSKERKILDDATNEASQIISQTEFVSQDSVKTIDHALETLTTDMNKEAVETANLYQSDYQKSLKELTDQSLHDFQNVSKEMQEDLRKQMTAFHTTLLPQLEKELTEYKEVRMQDTERLVKSVIQKVSQEVLHKSLTLDDQQKILIDALERAKREGVFE
jgi:hypothetical protein